MDDLDFGSARLLSEPHNYAVVQLPGRSFPGVVFQGDSLHSLQEAARALAERSDPDELRQEAAAIADALDEILAGYVAVVTGRGDSLPFTT